MITQMQKYGPKFTYLLSITRFNKIRHNCHQRKTPRWSMNIQFIYSYSNSLPFRKCYYQFGSHIRHRISYRIVHNTFRVSNHFQNTKTYAKRNRTETNLSTHLLVTLLYKISFSLKNVSFTSHLFARFCIEIIIIRMCAKIIVFSVSFTK